MKIKQHKLMKDIGLKIFEQEFKNNDLNHTFSEQYIENKKSLLKEIELKDKQQKVKKRNAFITAACAIIIFIPATTFAANAVISQLAVKKQQTNKYAYEYNFEEDTTQGSEKSELYHSNVKFEFGYMPEGYIESQNSSNKFSLNGDWYSNQNISVLLNYVEDKSKLSFSNVLETNDMTIGNNEASLLHLNATDKTAFCKILLVFYNDYGYTLQIYAQEDVDNNDLIKIAENLQLVQCSKEESAAPVAYQKSSVAVIPSTNTSHETLTLDDSNFLNIGDYFSGFNVTQYNSTDLTYTVEGVEIKDSIRDLDQSGFGYDYDSVQQVVDSDGNLMPFVQKQIAKGDGQTSVDTIVGETTSNLKLIYVTMKVKNTSDNLVDHIRITPQICCLESNSESVSLPLNRIYSTDAISSEGWCIYCNRTTMYDENPNTADSKQSLIQRYSIKPQEEFEYHVAYIVDAAKMNNMVLFFNPAGKIETNSTTHQTIIKLY